MALVPSTKIDHYEYLSSVGLRSAVDQTSETWHVLLVVAVD
jgi:hypothetical protein